MNRPQTINHPSRAARLGRTFALPELFEDGGAHLLYYTRGCRIPERVCLVDISIFETHAKLTEPALLQVNGQIVFLAQVSRHPGGDELLDGSNGTVTNRDVLHLSTFVSSMWDVAH